jgi:hypothetical protein
MSDSASKIEGSSDRVFGCVMSVFFALIAFGPILSGNKARSWAWIISLLFLLPAIFYPSILKQLNRGWMRVGLAMSYIMSPIAMGIVFFAVITPFGLVMKLFGKTLMPLKFDPAAKSYWISRETPGPDPKSMKNSF